MLDMMQQMPTSSTTVVGQLCRSPTQQQQQEQQQQTWPVLDRSKLADHTRLTGHDRFDYVRDALGSFVTPYDVVYVANDVNGAPRVTFSDPLPPPPEMICDEQVEDETLPAGVLGEDDDMQSSVSHYDAVVLLSGLQYCTVLRRQEDGLMLDRPYLLQQCSLLESSEPVRKRTRRGRSPAPSDTASTRSSRSVTFQLAELQSTFENEPDDELPDDELEEREVEDTQSVSSSNSTCSSSRSSTSSSSSRRGRRRPHSCMVFVSGCAHSKTILSLTLYTCRNLMTSQIGRTGAFRLSRRKWMKKDMYRFQQVLSGRNDSLLPKPLTRNEAVQNTGQSGRRANRKSRGCSLVNM